jgi:hypothetical protein
VLPGAVVVGSRRRRHRSHERAATDAGRHVPLLAQAPVHAHGGEVVDAGLLGERACGRQLVARGEVARVDRGANALGDLAGD